MLVIGVLIWSAVPGALDFEGSGPGQSENYYNLLVQGFRAGQLNVKRDPSPGLAQLPDPYDPAANKPYVWDERHFSHDMSYYKGKLYLYFGITPAVVLFWPYVTVTGHNLSDRNACVIFSVLGFAAAAALIYGIWRRYFPETGPWIAACGAAALGLAGGLLEILSSCEVYEVAISCGFAFAMMALAAIWRGLHESSRTIRWFALASLAYGLAVGARPSLLFGSIILLIAVAAVVHREWGRVSLWRCCLLIAAIVVPLSLVGSGLMLYNYLRFGSPFEFGWHYALTGINDVTAKQFSLGYLWFNFCFYFLELMRWTSHFPFLQVIVISPLPPGYAGIGEGQYCGIFCNYPVAWLALAAPLAWKGRPTEETATLRWFAAGVFLLFLMCAVTICLFVTSSSRYEEDFLPVLLLLAVIGLFGLERQVARSAFWRPLARAAWCAALMYSLVFNALATIDSHAATQYFVGNYFFNHGRMDLAIEYFDKASTLEPDSAGFHYSLANALSQAGRTDESLVQFQKALKIQPDYPEADNNLAFTLLRAGDVDGAIEYFQKASEVQESYQAFYNLGYAYRMKKMAFEAETNWQKAMELQPKFIPAQIDLSWMLATWPDAAARNGGRALDLIQNLDREVPNDPKILRALAAADAETGRFSEAIISAKRALAIAQARTQTTLVKKIQTEITLYQSNTPCRSFNN